MSDRLKIVTIRARAAIQAVAGVLALSRCGLCGASDQILAWADSGEDKVTRG